MLNIVLEMILNLSVVGLLFGTPIFVACKEHGTSLREEIFSDEDE